MCMPLDGPSLERVSPPQTWPNATPHTSAIDLVSSDDEASPCDGCRGGCMECDPEGNLMELDEWWPSV